MSNLLSYLDPKSLIQAFGTLGVVAVIFMETGFFFGFFFPGDSLLFTAGFFASQGYLPVGWLLLGTLVAAILGDSLGYWLGKRAGPALFARDDSRFFNKKHIARAQHFYERHGGQTIVMARFIPVVRTFAPVVAGIGAMRYRTFLLFNVVGGLAWTILLIGLGYGFGRIIPDPDRYILPAAALVIVISALPAIRQLLKNKKRLT